MPACRTVQTSCSACCAKRAGGCRSATTARPEEIHRRTQLSKKAFKRSLGVLLKRGIVAADAEGIKLTKQ